METIQAVLKRVETNIRDPHPAEGRGAATGDDEMSAIQHLITSWRRAGYNAMTAEYCNQQADEAQAELEKLEADLIQTRADRENAYKEIREMNTPMVCGHAGRYAVNGEDGAYCVMCLVAEQEARNE